MSDRTRPNRIPDFRPPSLSPARSPSGSPSGSGRTKSLVPWGRPQATPRVSLRIHCTGQLTLSRRPVSLLTMTSDCPRSDWLLTSPPEIAPARPRSLLGLLEQPPQRGSVLSLFPPQSALHSAASRLCNVCWVKLSPLLRSPHSGSHGVNWGRLTQSGARSSAHSSLSETLPPPPPSLPSLSVPWPSFLFLHNIYHCLML